MLALALGYFAIDKFVISHHREAARQTELAERVQEARQSGRVEARDQAYGENSIVVLPFENLRACGRNILRKMG